MTVGNAAAAPPLISHLYIAMNSASLVVADEIKKLCTFAKNKARGSVALLQLMFIYLLSRLASKTGKTDIGDTLVKESSSRLVVYLHFLLFYLFEP